MYLTSFCVCETFENDNQGGQKLVRPLGNIGLPVIPTLYSFCISIGLSGENLNENRKLTIMLKSLTDGETIFSVDENIPDVQDQKKSLNLSMQINNIKFNHEGMCEFFIEQGDKPLASFKINVFLIKESEKNVRK